MTQFFSCDWGTTSFRLRRVNAADGSVLDERRDPSGVKVLFATCPAGNTPAREKIFADFLRKQINLMTEKQAAPAEDLSMIISGMASSSIGWRELPYASLPIGLDGSGIKNEQFDLEIAYDASVSINLISGVRSEDDVMRGEEIEICGLFAEGNHSHIATDGIIVLPGTHSKHVRLRDQKIIGFHTYMTGELFDVLSEHSLLRASVHANTNNSTLSHPASRDSFIAGVRAALSCGLARNLFQTRTRALLQSIPPTENGWFLSGLLIGSEVADLSTLESNLPILLAAAEPQSSAYRLAFETLGLSKRLAVVPPEEMATASVRGHLMMLRRNLTSPK